MAAIPIYFVATDEDCCNNGCAREKAPFSDDRDQCKRFIKNLLIPCRKPTVGVLGYYSLNPDDGPLVGHLEPP